MEYDFRKIERQWQEKWKADKVYKVSNDSARPKCYVLDMFPYPSGAGLHVGHPLGYIASDIYSRYKRLKGFNVLHPMGFDSFGLPAEQYALETGQHPAETTEKNITTFKQQLDKIGFCYDWDREVRTSDPQYYKWTQWIFLQLYNSYFCNTEKKALPISLLIKKYETKGAMPKTGEPIPGKHFTADQWNSFTKKEQENILMNRRLAFSAFGEVNWCEALGTVLANDEVVNGVSERGGHPVEKKKMRQWFLRITSYADRLLEGLETVEFSDAMKEMQKNWIGKSEGAEMVFPLSISPRRGEEKEKTGEKIPGFGYANYKVDNAMSFEHAKEMRKEPTETEKILWDAIRNRSIEYKFRRQHPIENYIVDFVCLDVWLIIEVDGGYHNKPEQKEADANRDRELKEIGFTTLRITNEAVINDIDVVLKLIKNKADEIKQSSVEKRKNVGGSSPLEGEAGVRVYTTRPDTIFGVDFMVLAPEHDLISKITSADQKEDIEKYLAYVKSRSERERLAEAKTITGCFTGAYAVNPFDGREIPIWIAEYVLAGYGTGAIMAVPCGDQRDFLFAKHFNIPITNIIGKHYTGEEANATKDAILENSVFLNGLLMKDAITVAINKIEELGIGKKKVNYRMRDAGFSRQRYWGEPFPIIWSDGIALPLDAEELPLELPHVDKYGPGPNGEGPLANLKEWVDLTPGPSPKERGERPQDSTVNKAPGYINSSVEEWRKTIAFAKQNRKDATVEEDIIWQELRNRKIAGFKFRRQHPVAGYVPDFVCLEKKLIVEIDGEYHNEEEQIIFDKARESWLNEEGFTMIRFTNYEVNNSLNSVLKNIEQALLNKETVTKDVSSNPPLPWRGVGGEVKRETSTMPGYAGSSWYFLRYMDPHNSEIFCDRKASDYWNQVDLYIGGTEHAVGHLLYSRMWTKVLFDLGLIGFDEPFKKLLNQGMIQGSSRFIYRAIIQSALPLANEDDKINYNKQVFVSRGIIEKIYGVNFTQNYVIVDTEKQKQLYAIIKNRVDDFPALDAEGPLTSLRILEIHVDVNIVDGIELDIEVFKKWKPEYVNAEFILEDGKYICGIETEKMSKSKYNTVNPDELCEKYGADTFRMYEMFLGPVEASKPWDTKGIEGVHRFLRKLWRLFNDDLKGKVWNEDKATDAELKILHRTIKKIEEDTERFSFNTAVSTFMICVNELADLKCHKKEILEPLLILLAPYAPHISEELYQSLSSSQVPSLGGDLGEARSVLDATYPTFNPALLVESEKEYPVSINGKLRTNINLALDLEQQQVEEIVLQNEIVQKWLEGKAPKKIIFVKNKMINVVL